MIQAKSELAWLTNYIESLFDGIETAQPMSSIQVSAINLKDFQAPDLIAEPLEVETRTFYHQSVTSHDGDNLIIINSPGAAVTMWAGNMLKFLSEHPKARKRLYWRTMPELDSEKSFDTNIVQWKVYSRLSITDWP